MKVSKTERKLIAAVAELHCECSAHKEHLKMLQKLTKLAEKAIEELMDENYKLKQRVEELTPKDANPEAAPTTKTPTPAAKATVKKDGTPKRKPGPPKKTATVVEVEKQPELPLVDGVDVSPGAAPSFM